MASTVTDAAGWLLMQPSPPGAPAGQPTRPMQREERRGKRQDFAADSRQTGPGAPIKEDASGADGSLLLQELEGVAEGEETCSLARKHLAFLQAAGNEEEGAAKQTQHSARKRGDDTTSEREREREKERESKREKGREREREGQDKQDREEREQESAPSFSKVRVLKFWNEIDARQRRRGRVKGEGAEGGGRQEGGGGEVRGGGEWRDGGEGVEDGRWKKEEAKEGKEKEPPPPLSAPPPPLSAPPPPLSGLRAVGEECKESEEVTQSEAGSPLLKSCPLSPASSPASPLSAPRVLQVSPTNRMHLMLMMSLV